VFYTRLGSNRSDGSDLPAWARRLNEAGCAAFGSPVFPMLDDPDAQLDERLMAQPKELILPKMTTGALASSSLEVELRTRGITSVVVTGVLSAYCVTQTARELADRSFDVALVENACASLTEEAHAAALGAFAAVYGWVLSTTDLLAAIQGHRGVKLLSTPPARED
jgi:nicotinamidase-related amidase